MFRSSFFVTSLIPLFPTKIAPFREVSTQFQSNSFHFCYFSQLIFPVYLVIGSPFIFPEDHIEKFLNYRRANQVFAEVIARFALLQINIKNSSAKFKSVVAVGSAMCGYAVDIDDSVKKFFSARKIIPYWKPEFSIQNSIKKRTSPEDELEAGEFYLDFLRRKEAFLERINNRGPQRFNNRGYGRSRGRGNAQGRGFSQFN